MSIDWTDVSSISFNTLLLLEKVQLSWFPDWLPETELAIALNANPVVEWYMRNKCPELSGWIDGVMAKGEASRVFEPNETRWAEEMVMNTINDLITYVVDPEAYDSQPFLQWDPKELLSVVDFSGKMVIDVGSGTGKLTLIAAPKAEAVYSVEPIANLREYLKDIARKQGLSNVYPVDGLITDIPILDRFADVTMGGHVFGDQPAAELQEMIRVTKSGGVIVLCPGSSTIEEARHHFLVSKGFEWSRFEEPGRGLVQKYWKKV